MGEEKGKERERGRGERKSGKRRLEGVLLGWRMV